MEEITTKKLMEAIKNELIECYKNLEHLKTKELNSEENVSDLEVETFILTNPYFDEMLSLQLMDRDFAGFHPNAKIYEYWREGFVEQVRKWATSKEWGQLKTQLLNKSSFEGV